MDNHKTHLPNVVRRLLMRVQPYMAPSSQIAVAYKALQILQNVAAYMARRPMVAE